MEDSKKETVQDNIIEKKPTFSGRKNIVSAKCLSGKEFFFSTETLQQNPRIKFELPTAISNRRYLAGKLVIPITRFTETEMLLENSSILSSSPETLKAKIQMEEFLSLLERKKIEDYELPIKLKHPLAPFQNKGINYLVTALSAHPDFHCALLGDAVGSGKTVQAIVAALILKQQGVIDNCLIICPASLKRKWGEEITKFTDADYSLAINGAEGRYECYTANTMFRIVNYDVLHRDIQTILPAVSDRTLIIADEIQYCKNWKAKRTKAVRKIVDKTDKKILMSATFMENRLEELFSVAQILDPTILGWTFTHFDERYIDRDWWGKATTYKRTDEIKDYLRPFLIRRRKDEIRAEMGTLMAEKVIENDYYVTLHPEQRKIYDEIRKNISTSIMDAEKADKITLAPIIAQLIYLQQACLDTSLVGGDKQISTKLDELLKFMESVDEESKVVIFCHFTKMVEIIGKALKDAGWNTIYVYGSQTSQAERSEVIKRFSEDPKVQVLVSSDILKEGVDLQAASYLVNFDLLWNPKSMEQRAGRIDRPGQKAETINIINIIAQGTIEERIHEVIKEKRELFTDIIDDGKIEKRLSLRVIKDLLEI